MITKTITLGEREYEVKALTIREADVWREKLNGPFAEIVEVLQGAEDVELSNARDLAGLLRTVTGNLVESPKIIRRLLFEYAPALLADADWILDNAYDEEIFDAFVEVLKLAFPFGKVTQMFRGQGRRGTSRK
jgi:hypothetical protein